MTNQQNVADLDNTTLWKRTLGAVADERTQLVALLKLLGEVDARQLYRESGYSSLWAFMRSLGLSEGECAARCTAARVIRRYPWVGEALNDGRLHLTGIAAVGRRALRDANEALLHRACGANRAELDALMTSVACGKLADLTPARMRSSIRPIIAAAPSPRLGDPTEATAGRQAYAMTQDPASQATLRERLALEATLDVSRDSRLLAGSEPEPTQLAVPAHLTTPAQLLRGAQPAVTAHLPTPAQLALPPAASPHVTGSSSKSVPPAVDTPPVAPIAYRVSLVLTPEAHANLQTARELCSHQHPDGDLNAIVALALRAFVKAKQTRKFGASSRSPTTNSQRSEVRSQANSDQRSKVRSQENDPQPSKIRSQSNGKVRRRANGPQRSEIRSQANSDQLSEVRSPTSAQRNEMRPLENGAQRSKVRSPENSTQRSEVRSATNSEVRSPENKALRSGPRSPENKGKCSEMRSPENEMCGPTNSNQGSKRVAPVGRGGRPCADRDLACVETETLNARRDGATSSSAPDTVDIAPSPLTARRRRIPAALRRRVFDRDRGCCTFIAPDGTPCASRTLLEFDHVYPFGLGGDHTEENLRLRCRAHNALAAEQIYGALLLSRGAARRPAQ